VGVSGNIVNLHGRGRDEVRVSVEVVHHQLGQRLQAVHGAVDGLGGDGDHGRTGLAALAKCRDVQRVRLVGGELGVGLGVVSDGHFDLVDGVLGGLSVIYGVVKDKLVVALKRLGQSLNVSVLGNILERKHVGLFATGDE